MSRDHSLDDFGGDTPGDDAADTGDAERTDTADPTGDAAPEAGGGTDADEAADTSDGVAADDTVPTDDAAPAEPTRAWSSDGAACAACGATAAVRWRDEGGYVCPDCKEW